MSISRPPHAPACFSRLFRQIYCKYPQCQNHFPVPLSSLNISLVQIHTLFSGPLIKRLLNVLEPAVNSVLPDENTLRSAWPSLLHSPDHRIVRQFNCPSLIAECSLGRISHCCTDNQTDAHRKDGL
ncbi:unnamed protein product [Protopolystoma xenopodis]|uniref:Uncharacterized protein n=1 Tax=Protopolystoma xenopodis TaxID=117903 RepID=A0A3S5A3S7_9PLAT|nr:unnamed protein product [Protopolystoma xenopodis]